MLIFSVCVARNVEDDNKGPEDLAVVSIAVPLNAALVGKYLLPALGFATYKSAHYGVLKTKHKKTPKLVSNLI